MTKARSPHEHDWVRAAVRGGIVAGVVGALVLTFIRLIIAFALLLLLPFTISSLLTRSWHLYWTRDAAGEIWVALKLGAYPFLGPRALEPGFDIGAILIGVAVVLVFSICLGVVFGLAAHGRSRRATLALGAFCGIVLWMVNLHFINPSIAPVLIEFIPYGLAMAGAFLWYQGRPPRRRA